MAKSKYDFIIELMQSKKLDLVQRERILSLAAKEIENENSKDENILKRIEEIEQQLNPGSSNDTMDEADSKYTFDKPKYIDPKGLYEFLKDYNTHPILKTTCHEIDSSELSNILEYCKIENYDFLVHKVAVQRAYSDLANNKRYFVDYKIKNLISVYLTGLNFNGKLTHWTDDKIKLNWESPDITTWSQVHRNKVPHPDFGLFQIQNELEYKIKPSIPIVLLGNKKLTNFSEMILHFKCLFHLRSDNSLLEILRRVNSETVAWKEKIYFIIDEMNFPINIEFFTNVEALVMAYRKLIELILEVSTRNKLGFPQVKLSLQATSDGMDFLIHHQNSRFQKTLENTLERDGQTIYNLIKKHVNGVCDLYLSADFGGGVYAEINLWNGGDKICKYIDPIVGVEYKLKFRKK